MHKPVAIRPDQGQGIFTLSIDDLKRVSCRPGPGGIDPPYFLGRAITTSTSTSMPSPASPAI